MPSIPFCFSAFMKPEIIGLTVLLALVAGVMDWRSRRIPNWLTVPGLLVGVAANTLLGGWSGVKGSLLGALLGLGLLLPFVLVRSLGAGDWKLVGALGSFLGPGNLLNVLLIAVLVAGIMAVILIIWKRRIRQTLQNMLHILGSFFSLHLPRPELSLDSQDALKIPFGVAVTVAVIVFSARQIWGLA
jgi:prepilin peptidase CpaA